MDSKCQLAQLNRTLLAFYFLSLLSVCGALTLSRVLVPTYILAGETVTLECPYELKGNGREQIYSDKIYSVKWYKDNEEFYRYVPKHSPPVRFFDKLDGIRVQMSASDAKQVTLRNLDLGSTGVYRCEVSAEGPSFASVHGEGKMTVVHLPEGGKPRIEGKVKAEYEVGDELNFTCSAGKSFPPVKLSWYINDVPVPPDQVIDLSPRHSSGGGHHLTPSLSQLKVTLGEEHFREEGETRILCKANFAPLNTWHDGDDRAVASSRKSTEYSSSSNSRSSNMNNQHRNTAVNDSPVILFDENATLTIRGDGTMNRFGITSLWIFSLCTLTFSNFFC